MAADTAAVVVAGMDIMAAVMATNISGRAIMAAAIFTAERRASARSTLLASTAPRPAAAR